MKLSFFSIIIGLVLSVSAFANDGLQPSAMQGGGVGFGMDLSQHWSLEGYHGICGKAWGLVAESAKGTLRSAEENPGTWLTGLIAAGVGYESANGWKDASKLISWAEGKKKSSTSSDAATLPAGSTGSGPYTVISVVNSPGTIITGVANSDDHTGVGNQ